MAVVVFQLPDRESPTTINLSDPGRTHVVGRQEGVEVWVPNTSVSRRHAELFARNGAYWLRDLKSANGTLLNGERVDGERMLHNGDRIECGEVALRFEEGRFEDARYEERQVRPPKTRALEEAPPPRESLPAEPAALTPPRSFSAASFPAAAPELSRRETGQRVHVSLDLFDDGAPPVPAPRAAASQPAAATPAPESVGAPSPAPAPQIAAALAERERERTEHQAEQRKHGERVERLQMQSEATADKLRKAIDELRQTQRLLEQEREKISNLQKKSDDDELTIERLNERVRGLTEYNSEHESRMRELKVQQAQSDRDRRHLSDELAHTEFELRQAREEIDRLKTAYNQDEESTSKLRNESGSLRVIIEAKENELGRLRQRIEERDLEIRLLRQREGYSALESEQAKLLKDFHLKSKEVDSLSDELNTLRQALQAERSKVAETDRRLTDAGAHTQRVASEHEHLVTRLAEARGQIATLAAAKEQLERELAETGAKSGLLQQLSELQSDLAAAERQRQQLEARAEASRRQEREKWATATRSELRGLTDQLDFFQTYAGDLRRATKSLKAHGDDEFADLMQAADAFVALSRLVCSKIEAMDRALQNSTPEAR